MSKENILSVSQLNRKAKQLLQTHLHMVWVRGEISSLSKPASGHWYFTLKDQSAQIRCAMFKGRNQLLKFLPKEGDEVIIRGQVSLYETRGDYQLIAEHIEAEGDGRLKQAFEALKRKLLSEGLFDAQHKIPLPNYPLHIGIVSSHTGAAMHDICSTLKRRWPICEISIFSSLVQGDKAAQQIADQINRINQQSNKYDKPIEAIIVGRGGGSLEDLQAFNEEVVARAIFKSKLPIISAVGHETDFSISDFVADSRAATPTAAAELISPDIYELHHQIDELETKIIKSQRQQIQQYLQSTQALKRSMKHPLDKIKHHQLNFSKILQALHANISKQLELNKKRLNESIISFSYLSPAKQISAKNKNIIDIAHSLKTAIEQNLNQKYYDFESQATLLNAFSPLNTLQRGYSISTKKNGDVVYSVKQVKTKESLSITLKDGELVTTIDSIHKHE